MEKKYQFRNLKSGRYLFVLILLVMTLTLMSCQDWSVNNQRITPTYVCEGEETNVVVTWDYSGPKAKVKITSVTDEVLCSSGARTGYCAFDRPINQDDLPLKVKVYKKDDLKATFPLLYLVLSGTEATEEFKGTLDWSEPYEKTIYEKRPVYDNNGHPTGEVEQVPVTLMYKSAEKVKWDLNTSWFTSRVITESVMYKTGSGALEIEGSGIVRTSFYVNQIRPGNLQHPGGTWFGYFTPKLEVLASSIDIGYWGLVLNIRCRE